MTRVLLAEHSPHAQRMGERILREEGYAVVSVTDGETAMMRLRDVQPHLVFADVGLNGFSGYDLCEYVKNSGAYPETRVILTVGALETVRDDEAQRVRADGTLRKPFEASVMLALLSKFSPPVTAVVGVQDRTEAGERIMRPTRSVVVLDPDQVRAAVTVALDEAFESLAERVTTRVLEALARRK